MSTPDDDSELGPGLHVLQGVLIFLNYPWMLLRNRLGLFKPLETAVLAHVIERLDPATAEIARSQLAEINWVLRTTATRTECNLHRIVPFRSVRDRRPKFPFPETEVPLATMRFQVGTGEQLRVKVFVVRGNLFSLDFSKDVRRVFRQPITSVISFKQHASAAG